MKSTVRKLLTKICAVDPEEVISTIEKSDCKVVSFDIFDTLLKRDVPTPKDVFTLLEKQFRRKFGGNINIGGLRSGAEAKAAAILGRREVSFQEIYQAIDGISDEEREWLMAEEVRIESAVCRRCYPMGKVFDWCAGRGIPIILVSDMYLPREIITQLLYSAGYSGWKRLYISAEERGNKANGTLFDIVLREECLKPGELLHIGDSLRGDYMTPRGKGIQAILVMAGYFI